jgi:uncharacterized protein YbjT (DUF2867 family)
VWSTLEDTRAFEKPGERMPALGPNGEYCVPHFDEKGAADERFRSAGVPTTFLRTSFFFDNFLPGAGLGPKRAAHGDLVLALPMPRDIKLAGIAVADIGGCAAGAFMDPEATIGKTLGIAGDHLTGVEYADCFSKILRRDIKYEAIDVQKYRASGAPHAEEWANMYDFYAQQATPFLAARPLSVARKLNPQLLSFEAWLREHQAAFAELAQ